MSYSIFLLFFKINFFLSVHAGCGQDFAVQHHSRHLLAGESRQEQTRGRQAEGRREREGVLFVDRVDDCSYFTTFQ